MANTLTAPPWVQETWSAPNYTDPDTKGKSLEHVAIAFSVFGTAVVLLRCYSRVFLTRAFGLDDAFIIVALLSCIALSVLLVLGIEKWYLGYHIWDLPAESVIDHRRGMWIATFINLWASCCIRISILLFYRRLSISFTRGFLIAVWLGIAYNVCMIVVFALANAFICLPTQAFWLRYDIAWRTSHHWKCGNEGISLPTAGIATVIADIYCTILPLALVMTLKIPQRQKFALFFLFGLGFLACGSGIVRVTYLCWTVWRSWDFTWTVYDMWVWQVVELFLGIFVACAPSLKPLARKCLGSRILGYTYTYGSERRSTARHGSNAGRDGRATVTSTIGSKKWSASGSEWKSIGTTATVSSVVGDQEKELESSRTSIHRPVSLLSTSGSLEIGRASSESFPQRRSRLIKTIPLGGPIIEEQSAQPAFQEVGVDPPIYPVAALLRPNPSRVSQLAVGGLGTAHDVRIMREARRPELLQTQQDSYGCVSDSSPLPRSNMYLSKDGWVELKPAKKTHDWGSAESLGGSVTAARMRAGARNESRILQPSASEPQAMSKPYYDAESSHTATFVSTPLPRLSHESAIPSDDRTRLGHGDSSESTLVTDLTQFHFDLSTLGSHSSFTALPQLKREP